MRNRLLCVCLFAGALWADAGHAQPAGSTAPHPQFQGDFFGEMPRAFCVIRSIDPKQRALTVKLDGSGEIRTVPIHDDTELHVRDSWGELSDYFVGQHVMLFMYADEERRWTYPRAVQDDIHMRARHNHFARIVRIDHAGHTYTTERLEKSGTQTRTIRDTITFAADAKVWKGERPGGQETLSEGDQVIQQLVERDGKLVATEILDRKGDDAVRAAQDARHRESENREGLTATVNDTEPTSGSLVATVAWSGAERARNELKPGSLITLAPADGVRPVRRARLLTGAGRYTPSASASGEREICGTGMAGQNASALSPGNRLSLAVRTLRSPCAGPVRARGTTLRRPVQKSGGSGSVQAEPDRAGRR